MKGLNPRALLAPFRRITMVQMAPCSASLLCILVPYELQAQASLQAKIRVDTNLVVRDVPSTLFGSNIEWAWNGNLLWDTASDTLNAAMVDIISGLPP